MTAIDTHRVYRLGDFHSFSAEERQFLYLVPAGAIFELDPAARVLLDRLAAGEASHDELAATLQAEGIPDQNCWPSYIIPG